MFVGEATASPYAPETLERLDQLAVLAAQAVVSTTRTQADPAALGLAHAAAAVGGEARIYTVRDTMVDLVHAVLEPGPWHAAVTALLEDERALVIHRREAAVAAQATGELTKLITHEVRNALVPVRHHLDALKMDSSDASLIERIEKARRGVVRVLDFVDKLVATRDLIGEQATSCDVAEVIREALTWTDAAERVEIPPGGQYRVRAPRSRLVSAVHNVVLNALEATSAGGRVRASYRTNRDIIEIIVDDAGGGVPVELRATIFDDGYTTRGGQGHGFGLAFVRSVVEGGLRGRVWCEDSDLGGARFILAIPAEPKP